MKNNLTEFEYNITDSFLKKYINKYDDSKLFFTSSLCSYLTNNGVFKDRVKPIIQELKSLSIIKEEKTLNLTFDKEKIKSTIEKGGLTNIWLDKESKSLNIKLNRQVIKDYPNTKLFSKIGAITGISL